MKKYILIIVCLAFFGCLNAQTKRKKQFNIGLDIATPTTAGGYGGFETGFGGTAKMLFPTGKQSFITATTGIIRFAGKPIDTKEYFGLSIANVYVAHPAYTIIPFKVGYLTPFKPQSKFSVEVEVGYTYGTIRGVIEEVKSNRVSGITGALGFTAQIVKSCQLGLRYEAYPSTYNLQDYGSFVSLRSVVNIAW